MSDKGKYIWERRDLKPDRHEREVLNFVERRHNDASKGIEKFSLYSKPQILSHPFFTVLTQGMKLK